MAAGSSGGHGVNKNDAHGVYRPLAQNAGTLTMRLLLITVGIVSATILFGAAAEAQNAPWCLQSSGDSGQHCTYGSFSAVSSRAPVEWFLYSKLHIPALHANHSTALTGRREAAS
jgi:hypothetical protein